MLLDSNAVEATKGIIQVFSISVADFDEDVVSRAVVNFIQGNVPNYDQAFPVKPPQLATECKRISGKALNSESPFIKFLAARQPAQLSDMDKKVIQAVKTKQIENKGKN